MPNSSQREYNVDRNGAFNVWMANSVVLQKRAWISIAVANLNREVVLVQRDATKRLAAPGNGDDGKVLWSNLSVGIHERQTKRLRRSHNSDFAQLRPQAPAALPDRMTSQAGALTFEYCLAGSCTTRCWQVENEEDEEEGERFDGTPWRRETNPART